MNKHIREKLSDIVKINEQFARSTRIDSDLIEQSGFIYSESIDTFLATLIKHQSSKTKRVYLDRPVRKWEVNVSFEFNFSFNG